MSIPLPSLSPGGNSYSFSIFLEGKTVDIKFKNYKAEIKKRETADHVRQNSFEWPQLSSCTHIKQS